MPSVHHQLEALPAIIHLPPLRKAGANLVGISVVIGVAERPHNKGGHTAIKAAVPKQQGAGQRDVLHMG